MASISELRFFRYRTDESSDLAELIAPPYDVISVEERARYHAIPHNITHLTLPSGGGDISPYDQARATLDEWIAKEVIVPDQEPNLWVYQQEFDIPADDEPIVRTGFVTGLRLVEFGEGGVLPHERTLSHHREDRKNLREATEADLEPIFGMYKSGGALDEVVRELSNAPDIAVTDRSGVVHRLWKISDPKAIESLKRTLADESVYIVDGHHRYATALQMAREHGYGDDDTLGSIMIHLCSMTDPGLIILPTHRIVHSVVPDRLASLLDGNSDLFKLETLDSVATGFSRLREAHDNHGRFLLMTSDRTILATLTPTGQSRLDSIYTGDESVLASLDVTVLHDLLFEQELGITRSMQEAGTHLRYSRNDQEAIDALADGDVQLVVAMNPPTIEQVRKVAESGQVMPQKSTYFYPKLASGLLLHVGRDDATTGRAV